MYEGALQAKCDTGTMTNPSPLAIARQRKELLEEQLKEVDRLIKLLESNPEIEELLKLSRRYI